MQGNYHYGEELCRRRFTLDWGLGQRMVVVLVTLVVLVGLVATHGRIDTTKLLFWSTLTAQMVNFQTWVCKDPSTDSLPPPPHYSLSPLISVFADMVNTLTQFAKVYHVRSSVSLPISPLGPRFEDLLHKLGIHPPFVLIYLYKSSNSNILNRYQDYHQ